MTGEADYAVFCSAIKVMSSCERLPPRKRLTSAMIPSTGIKQQAVTSVHFKRQVLGDPLKNVAFVNTDGQSAAAQAFHLAGGLAPDQRQGMPRTGQGQGG